MGLGSWTGVWGSDPELTSVCGLTDGFSAVVSANGDSKLRVADLVSDDSDRSDDTSVESESESGSRTMEIGLMTGFGGTGNSGKRSSIPSRCLCSP